MGNAPTDVPAALAGLSDQPRVRDFLARAVVEGRLSHAYLFVGAPGSGKHEAAEALAKCIVCPNGGDSSCDECRRVAHKTHPDVHWYAPASTVGYLADQVREVIADESRRLDELREVIDRRSREVFERIFMGEVMQRLYVNYMQIDGLVKRIQRKLVGRRFGSNRYEFTVSPLPEYEGFVELVRKGHLLDAAEGKDELRTYLEAHREEIMNADLDTVPPLFDYRKWFRFQLKVLVENEEGKVIDRKLKSMGSGGEQAVPNYLLILTVAEFLYHGSESSDPPKAAPLLFDEAFYGIDAARRDQLLAFADDLGLQLFVSSPDQDGVKREIRHSVSLIVVKDENLDVHLSPIHWNNTPSQGGLFGDEGPAVGMTVMEETR